MAALKRTLEQYVKGEDFEAYTERFEQVLEANNITEEKRKGALFPTVSGPAVYQLSKNLCALENLLKTHLRNWYTSPHSIMHPKFQ